MKKVVFLMIAMFAVSAAFISCKKDKKDNPIYGEELMGVWTTAKVGEDGGYVVTFGPMYNYEIYLNGGLIEEGDYIPNKSTKTVTLTPDMSGSTPRTLSYLVTSSATGRALNLKGILVNGGTAGDYNLRILEE